MQTRTANRQQIGDETKRIRSDEFEAPKEPSTEEKPRRTISCRFEETGGSLV